MQWSGSREESRGDPRCSDEGMKRMEAKEEEKEEEGQRTHLY